MKKTAMASVLMSLLACSGGGSGTLPVQQAPYENDFEGEKPLAGWLFSNPSVQNQVPSGSVQTLWKADATPNDLPGGPAYNSTNSLNYNNGTSYDTGGTNQALAISPYLNVSAMAMPVVAFRCNYQTDTEGTATDQRWLKIGYLDPDNKPVYFINTQLSTNPGSIDAGPCGPPGIWHLHVVTIDPSWGQLHIAFHFNTVNATNNNHRGWFVDNLQVVETEDVDYGLTSLVTVYETHFDTPESTVGWSIANSVAGVGWGFDGTPANAPGGAFFSAPGSLNYNNGTNYASGTTKNTGTAASPKMNLAGLADTKLRFKCNYQTDTSGTETDHRIVQVSNNDFAGVVLEGKLAETGGAVALGKCSNIGAWHTHTVKLDPAWGVVQVKFAFDTVDGNENNFAGHFIDDFKVTGEGTLTPVAGSTEGRHKSKKKRCSSTSTESNGFSAALVLLGVLALAASVRMRKVQG